MHLHTTVGCTSNSSCVLFFIIASHSSSLQTSVLLIQPSSCCPQVSHNVTPRSIYSGVSIQEYLFRSTYSGVSIQEYLFRSIDPGVSIQEYLRVLMLDASVKCWNDLMGLEWD